MDQEKLKYFTKLVLKERERILRGLSNVQEDLEETSEETLIEEIDKAFSSEGRELLSSFIDRHTEGLEAVNQALERIKEGTYGICVRCGKEISEERLEAIPTASLCLSCQQELERQSRASQALISSPLRQWTDEEEVLEPTADEVEEEI
ncbi:MAG: RNA polymerase-binding protein DksA [Candidatus Latescibacterota bacterium]|nr:MAG: RNA polymerase-binding protein DksA [Candidatus Latescibacterota bacterium]RKY66440.1 MAG: RNA polymerase-binding protein DksA [Candidatus Latescibacterota bacterium]RKY74454.1 MAG: RNA polymerase-binding protein DksA [Candidatus Latescibacterota bacterium]